MTHDKDERFSDYYKPNSNYNSKNKKKNINNNKNVVPKNSKEYLHLSAPINKKSALENIMKNENPFVAKYYQDDSDIPKTEEEEEILNSIIEEFQDGPNIVENFEDIDYKENIDKFKEANKCASHLLPYKEEKENDEGMEIHKSLNKKFHDLLKNKKHPVDIIKCDPSRLDNWKMYKKVEERISEKLDENDEPKTINQVYNESIIDFKKINLKLNKNEEERIQGKYKPTTNIGSSFSFFTNNNEVSDLMANESQFEFNSTI